MITGTSGGATRRTAAGLSAPGPRVTITRRVPTGRPRVRSSAKAVQKLAHVAQLPDRNARRVSTRGELTATLTASSVGDVPDTSKTVVDWRRGLVPRSVSATGTSRGEWLWPS